MIQIIPAIDIIEGRCVRLVQGRFDNKTVFSDEPAETAKRWENEGAPRIHVVDLDGARTGRPQNLEVVSKIVQSVNVPVQLGGGIRNIETAKTVLNTGVERVIIGTSAALNTDIALAMIESFGEHVIIGIDVLDGFVAVHGWQSHTKEDAFAFARKMETMGAKRIIFTDISRDGMLSGVNIAAIKQILDAVSIPVIASGGIGNLEDILKLAPLSSKGLEGVILGKALYTGAVNLTEAISAISEK